MAGHLVLDDLAALESLGAKIVTAADAQWPAGLRDLRDPPAFLTVRGALIAGGVALIGTREPDAPTRAMARDLALELAPRIPPIVAGLSPGVDAVVHRAALERGRATVAYLGSGLAACVDPDLAQAIVEGGGAVVSEYPPYALPTGWTRMHRDRLQAAHARCTVLIASELEGGAMYTMRFAAAMGRPRFVLDHAASGNRAALAAGATLLPWSAAAAAHAIVAAVSSAG